MAAADHPLSLEQGATWRLAFTWHRAGSLDANGTILPGPPIDLTGCTARMQIRRSMRQPALVFITTPQTVTTTDPVTKLTTTTETPNGITIDGPTGSVLLELTADQTNLLDIKTGVYDLEIRFNSGDVYRVLQGAVTVSPNVTRPDLDGSGTPTAGVVA